MRTGAARATRTLCIALVLASGGCAQVAHRPAQPALLEADDQDSQDILFQVLQEALGRPVTLAPDALTRESRLVIELVPALAAGQRLDGRDMAPRIEHFSLQKQGADCFLLREGVPKPLPLPGARCRAAQTAQ